MYQMKEQGKTPEKQPNEVGIGNLPEKEFRTMIVKMIQDLGKKMIQTKIFPQRNTILDSLKKLMLHQLERCEDWIHYHIEVNRDRKRVV